MIKWAILDLNQWHPAFLSLGEDLEKCAQKYRRFCYQYQPREKSVKKFYWGSQLLPKLTRTKKASTKAKKKKTDKQKNAEEEAKKLYQYWRENNPDIVKVAEKFILANCYNPDYVKEFLDKYY